MCFDLANIDNISISIIIYSKTIVQYFSHANCNFEQVNCAMDMSQILLVCLVAAGCSAEIIGTGDAGADESKLLCTLRKPDCATSEKI